MNKANETHDTGNTIFNIVLVGLVIAAVLAKGQVATVCMMALAAIGVISGIVELAQSKGKEDNAQFTFVITIFMAALLCWLGWNTAVMRPKHQSEIAGINGRTLSVQSIKHTDKGCSIQVHYNGQSIPVVVHNVTLKQGTKKKTTCVLNDTKVDDTNHLMQMKPVAGKCTIYLGTDDTALSGKMPQ